jgi:hypothetical protein
MTTARQVIESFDPDEAFLLVDGFDEALIGVVEGWFAGNVHRIVALYDYERCVEILQREGLEEDDAREYVDMNIAGAYVGQGTPAFATVYLQPSITPFLD